jgi:dynein light chain 1
MKPMPALRNLKILSLSRNKIKRIGGLDEIGDTLEELWLSYNVIDTLNGLHPCRKLKILYLSNNKITKWDEIDKLRDLPKIDKVVFTGNPIY